MHSGRYFYGIMFGVAAMICACAESNDDNSNGTEKGYCGNGEVDPGEKCDGNAGVPKTCDDYQPQIRWAKGGLPACSPECDAVTIGTCEPEEDVVDICGDAKVTGIEKCDPNAEMTWTCDDFDSSKRWVSGMPECNPEDCKQLTKGTCVEFQHCGDGKITGTEVCDGMLHVPDSCDRFDFTKNWEDGGAPACAPDCLSIVQGSCVEAFCGNGIISGKEFCDTDQGVPATCEEYNPDIRWKAGGKPRCNNTCTDYNRGTCEMLSSREITFANWNVQVDYASWGGSPVPPRAEALYKVMKKWEKRPDIFAIVEASPNWHHPTVTQYFEDLGYTWADGTIKDVWHDFGSTFSCGEDKQNAFAEGVTEDQAASCFLFTDLLYQKDKFDLLEADYVRLFPPLDWDGLPENCNLHIRGDFCSTYNPDTLYTANKAITFYAVLREKATGEIFISASNHWNPNNGVKDFSQEGIPGIIGPVADNELVRVYGAEKTAAFLKNLLMKYPDAHVFFGGDMNTVDLNIIFESSAGAILGRSLPSLITNLNNLMTGKYVADRLKDDFIGSHEAFKRASGLVDARSYAKLNLDNFEDRPTSTDTQITTYTSMFQLPVVIDYTFFSPEMNLMKYEVMTGDVYETISDHAPVVTTYQYDTTGGT